MDNNSSNFVKVQNPISLDNLTLVEQSELFKNVDINKLMYDAIPDYIKNQQKQYNTIPKSNPIVEELKEVKLELQTQTTELENIRYENKRLNSQIQTSNITIDKQKFELAKVNELNKELNNQVSSLRKQLKESNTDKIKRRIGDIIVGGIGGVITAILLFFITKYCGITF